MDTSKPRFWFPVKQYGWGWGIPVRWEGWAVLLLYIAIIGMAGNYFRSRDDVASFLITVALATAILLAVAAWKGERPVKWRWGKE
jgi:hypothetical protein